MKYFLYKILIAGSFYVNVVLSFTINEYLDEKQKYLDEMFSQKKRLLYKRDNSYISVESIKEIEIESCDYIAMFTYFDKTYVLTTNHIYETNDMLTNITLIPQNNSFDEIKNIGVITFTKSSDFKNTSFFIIKSELKGEIYIYTSQNGKYSIIQTIFAPFSKDAHFFINNHNLYLLVLNNKGDNLAVSWVYKWLGFHFDEIQTIFTTAAIKVGSFTTSNAEIIIILQDLPNKTVPSAVYEFNNEVIIKTQWLKVTHPVNMDYYTNRNGFYLVIYCGSRNNTIYYWNYSEFEVTSKFYTKSIISKSAVLRVNGTSLIAVPSNENVQIYSTYFGKMKLEASRSYSADLSELLGIHTGNKDTINIIGRDHNRKLKIYGFSVQFDPTEIVTDFAAAHIPKNEVLRKCFRNLELQVDAVENFQLDGDVNQNVRVIRLNNITKEDETNAQIEQLENALIRVSLGADNFSLPKENDLVINGEVQFKSIVLTKSISGKDIVVKNMNDRKWVPEQWLKYEEPQTIVGHFQLDTLTSDYLQTNARDPMFSEMLLKDGNQVIDAPLSIKNLTAQNMYIKRINENETQVNIQNYFQKIENPEKLSVSDMRAKSSDEDSPREVLSTNSVSSSLIELDAKNVHVEHLKVETINGVPWEDFKNSVFIINSSKEINGPLNFNRIRASRLNVKEINGIDTETLFTTSTDQNIDVDVKVDNIVVNSIDAHTINERQFTENVIFINETDKITGPVIFSKVTVKNNFTISEPPDKSQFIQSGDHILGTQYSDLMQIYTGVVTIRGNVSLNDLSFGSNSKLVISNNELNPNIKEMYWSKNTQQEIPVQVKFKENVSVPHLLTEKINNVKLEQLMLSSQEIFKSDLKFKNITILGNVLLANSTKHIPDLNGFLNDAVRKTSETLQGTKVYLDTLTVESLQIPVLEGVNVSRVLNSKLTNIIGTKTIRDLVVENDVISNFTGVETINGISLNDIGEKYISIDNLQNLSRIDFQNLKVTNLYLEDINSHNIHDYAVLKNNLSNISLLQNLTIKGNVSIGHIKNISTLNDVPYEVFEENVIHIGDHSIINDVQFTKKIKVGNLITTSVNDLDLPNLTDRILTRHTDQNITAAFHFTNIKSENLLTSKINNVSVENLINVRKASPQKIYAPSGIRVSAANVKDVKAIDYRPCKLSTIQTEIIDPPAQIWDAIEVKGNITILDASSSLFRIFEKAVKISSTNIIHAEVNIFGNVSVKNLHTIKDINNVSFPDLLEDAIFSSSELPQEISGNKWFRTLQTNNAVVFNNADTVVLNEEEIISLVEDIVEIGDLNVKGTKTFFAGLQTNKFHSTLVGGIEPENLVTVNATRSIPEAIFESLVIENNLNIHFYQNVNFSDVIRNRLVIDGEDNQEAKGIYFFEDIEVQNLTTPLVNEIVTEDIIFDIDTQDVIGPKTFNQPLRIVGNIIVGTINDINLDDSFNKSISIKDSANMSGSVTFLAVTTGNGTINSKFINGQPVSLIKKILSSNDRDMDSKVISSVKSRLLKTINNTLPLIKKPPEDFLYLEQSNSLQVEVPNSVRAATVSANDYVLIHVSAYESGEHCELPNNCSCPLQYSMEISPEFSINILQNRGSQRIFTYDDGKSTIIFMTNSVSTSCSCRTNKSKLINEISMMTWTTKTTNTTKGAFFKYEEIFMGYITKVDFFTVKNKTYVVIGRSYDPVMDKYDLDCIIIQFNEDRTFAREIQKIRTNHVEEVYLLQTAQGVLLILGNNIPSDINHEQEETVIYRFSTRLEKFEFLRRIPFGCSMATGVVSGGDSLIVLAHREIPIQVLKYYMESDSYEIYQRFELDDRVSGLSSFYSGGFGLREAYLCIVTSSERYYIYSYRYLEGFKLKFTGEVEGLRNLVPLELNQQMYLFATSVKNSSLLNVVTNGL